MADLTITPANVKASASASINKQWNAGATITAGQAVYLDSATNTWLLADANLSAAAADLQGVAAHGASAGQPLAVITDDPDFTHGITGVAAGAVVILSATAGALAPVADAASGMYIAVVLVCKSATKGVLRLVKSGAAM